MIPASIDVPLQIETERLIMRPLQLADTESFFAAAKETYEGLNRWYGGPLTKRDLSLDDARSNILSLLKMWEDRTFLHFGAFEKASGRFVGIGSLHHLDWDVPKGRIGYWIRQGTQAKGYATEIANALTRLAFDRLAMKRLEIRCATNNTASQMIPQRLGYQFLTVFEKNKAGNNGEIWDLQIHVRFDSKNLPPLTLTFA